MPAGLRTPVCCEYIDLMPPNEQNEREIRDRKDFEIINRNADRLNREALDTLEYQDLAGTGLTVPLRSRPRRHFKT